MGKVLACIIAFLCWCHSVSAREISAEVQIDFQNSVIENSLVINELKTQLFNYINDRRWNETSNEQSSLPLKMTFVFMVNSVIDGRFKADLQVIAQRPVYNSGYYSPILLFNDLGIEFTFNRGDKLTNSNNTFLTNIVPLVDYYCFLALGLERDSFSRLGGTKYFLRARSLVDFVKNLFPGWNYTNGTIARPDIIDEILSPENADYRQAWYTYHYKGLDHFILGVKQAKQVALDYINTLLDIRLPKQQNRLIRFLMITKQDELVNIFKSGPKLISKRKIRRKLNTLYPPYQEFWDKIE